MASTPQACLAIGIADAGGLDYLGGALNGAREMHQWAQAMGYRAELLVDDEAPVDIARLKKALEDLLPPGSATRRLILYFAGHGFIGRADEGLWLLSDWQQSLRAVAVEALKHRLREFGVEQIAIIADACRQLPPDMRVAHLAADAVLGAGFTRPQTDPLVDRFTASQDGRAAYMLPGATPEQDRCIFSGVLLEGLWGLHEEAFSKRAAGQVISTSLADFLRRRVPEVARRYALQMDPQTQAGFPELQDVYFDRSQAPAVRPQLPPWPELAPGATEVRAQREGPARAPGPQTVPRATAAPGLLGRGLGWLARQVVDRLVGRQVLKDLGGVTKQIEAGPDIDDLILEGPWQRPPAADPAPSRQQQWLAEREQLPARDAVAKRVGQLQAELTLALIRAARVPPDLPCGLVVAGAEVAAVWGPRTLPLQVRPQAVFGAQLDDGAGAQLVLELQDGRWVPCTLLGGMVTRIAIDGDGALALVLQPGYGQGQGGEIDQSIAAAESAIASLDGGLAIEEASDLAARLRMDKHVNPVLGVISAYLYDAVGDRDSIRRMACFYAMHQQALPFDIVFLADLLTHPLGDGTLEVDIPALAARAPRTPVEAGLDWTTAATQATRAPVAGRLPWMRRGWPYIAAPSEAERLMVGALSGLAEALAPSRFTTLAAAAGPQLVALLGLEKKT